MTIALKKYAVPLLITAVLTISVFLLFQGWGRSQAAWKYIPTNASAVITSDRMQDSVFSISESGIDLKQFPLVGQAAQSLSLLSWITRDQPIIDRTLQKKTISYSFHKRTSRNFGVILYVPLDGDTEASWWKKPNRQDIRVLHHTFQSSVITDVNDAQSKPVCSYIILDNYLIISKYGDLIEDVVRSFDQTLAKSPLQSQFENSSDSKYNLNIYLKKSVWEALLTPGTRTTNSIAQFLALFPATQDYHLSEPDNHRISFESIGSEKEENYVTDWLTGQKGKEFTHHSFISQQTAVLFRIASADSIAFKKRFQNWHSSYKTTAWDKLGYHIGNQRNELITNVGSELILCQLEESNSISDGKLALIEYSNYEKLRPILTKLARLAANETNVSLDKYQGYDLFAIAIPELPASLYGPLFSNFAKSYISYVGPYLVVTNSSQALRNYISDYENRISWQQSPELDSILISDSEPSQLSMVASPRKVLPGTDAELLPSKIESIVFECQFNLKKAYPKISIISRKRRTSGKVLNRTFLAGEIVWTEGNTGLITVSDNQTDGSAQLILTDQKNTLLRPDASYQKFATLTTLDGPLVASPLKVDFLNIGRMQLILATSKMVYAIDEDEQGITTVFSKTLPSGTAIRSLFRIEGGSEGSSRFVVVDEQDNLFLWENAMEELIRINRFKNFVEVQAPVQSLNQLGSRSLLITQKNGLIYLIKEEGTVRSGFPVDMLTRIESAFAWTQNAETAQPELVGVSALGELLRVDVYGKIRERTQLYRPSASSRFKTLFDKNSLDWLLVRSSDTKMAILDKSGKELFEIGNVVPNATIQYHYFGVDNRFISINSGKYTSLFDMTGRRLGDKPIPSDLPVRVAYQSAYYKLVIFGRSADKFQTWTIKIR
ncbi:hypothetical protein [Arundinibacter roseus]|uniref:DUF3352 domain-containing protein n=1 Tax=Arundinibacter roseus TaxID=2070510 RepID=A0A4R4K9M7_9BACT|nr:hypothetical protein [Arundinibacter roseus]TDB64438.1 hypothetical protein EZE20_12205 [Arundinibacter roseus]